MIERGRALGAALFAAGVLCARLVNAAEAAQPAGEVRSASVEIYVDGSPAAVERMRLTAAETFQRAGLNAVVRASADESQAAAGREKPLARAYVDLRNPLSPRVVVVDGQSERELARRTLEENASLETSIEAATLVLYMVVEALVTSGNASGATTPSTSSAAIPPSSPASQASTGEATPGQASPSPSDTERSGPARAAAEPAPPLPPAKSRPGTPRGPRDEAPESQVSSSSLDLQAGLFLRTTTLDAEHPLAGAGISLEAFGRGAAPELGVVLLGAAHLSATPAAPEARASIETYSFRVLPAVRIPFSSALSAVVGIGGGLDAFSVEARGVGAAANESSSASSAVDATLSAIIGVRLRLAERLHASVNAGADIDLSPHTFVAHAGPERRVLLELGRVRPSLSLGFALGLTSEPRPLNLASAR